MVDPSPSVGIFHEPLFQIPLENSNGFVMNAWRHFHINDLLYFREFIEIQTSSFQYGLIVHWWPCSMAVEVRLEHGLEITAAMR